MEARVSKPAMNRNGSASNDTVSASHNHHSWAGMLLSVAPVSTAVAHRSLWLTLQVVKYREELLVDEMLQSLQCELPEV